MNIIQSWSGGGYTCWLSNLLLILSVVGTHGTSSGENHYLCLRVCVSQSVYMCLCVFLLSPGGTRSELTQRFWRWQEQKRLPLIKGAGPGPVPPPAPPSRTVLGRLRAADAGH